MCGFCSAQRSLAKNAGFIYFVFVKGFASVQTNFFFCYYATEVSASMDVEILWFLAVYPPGVFASVSSDN